VDNLNRSSRLLLNHSSRRRCAETRCAMEMRPAGLARKTVGLAKESKPRLVEIASPCIFNSLLVSGCYFQKENCEMSIKQTTPQTIDDYIAGYPQDVQEILEKIRTTIRKTAPDAAETINYQIPTFTLQGNLVHFAAFKKHIGFYPTPSGIEAFKNELSVYKGAKGSVQFPLDQPMPFDLISRIVQFRVKENLERAEAKGKKK
jgi:uncharacterized protein YdhG (YjbR/CyaY superfamily)